MNAVHYIKEEVINNQSVVYLDADYDSDVTSGAIPAAVSYLEEHPKYDVAVLGIMFAELTIPRGTTLNEAVNMWEGKIYGNHAPSAPTKKEDGKVL